MLLRRNTNRPPARNSRAASDSQSRGSAHIDAPYSEIARSKLSDGSGTFLCRCLDQLKRDAELALAPPSSLELGGSGVHADDLGSASCQPGGEVGGSAAQLHHVQACDVWRQDADLSFAYVEHASGDLVLEPCGERGSVGVLGVPARPQFSIGGDMFLVRHSGSRCPLNLRF